MVQFDHRKGGAVSSKFLRTSQSEDAVSRVITESAVPDVIAESSEQILLFDEAAQFVFRAPRGSVVALGGLDGAALRELVDEAEHVPDDHRALFVRLRPATHVETYIEQIIAPLAETALRLWPIWYTDLSFGICGSGKLGQLAADVIAHEAADRVPGVSAAWVERAARLALEERAPRVQGVLPAVELMQLSLAISRTGLILIVDAGAAAVGRSNEAALVHALEWIAQNSHAAVVVLFPELPPPSSPFDRILYGARRVKAADGAEPYNVEPAHETIRSETWLVPWRGAPHPLSEIEQRLAAMLGSDGELAALFRFNWFVDTVRGSRPKVDLVWMDGQLVVELDGYPDHSTRRAFIGDRHRDYELMLSGYTVLRLANDEVVQDYGRAIEKIRDLVRLRRIQMNEAG
jgi:very-short-patch-repair endonuclease